MKLNPLVISSAALFTGLGLNAADVTWDNEANDGLWATATNWTGTPDNTVPQAGDDVFFSASTQTTIDVAGAASIEDLNITGGTAPGYTFGAGAVDAQTIQLRRIKMTGSVDEDQLVNAAVELNNNGVLQNYSTDADLIVAGRIGQTGGDRQLLIQGPGSVVLSSTENDSASGYKGNTVLQLGIDVTANSIGTGNLRLRQGTLTLNNDQDVAGISFGDDSDNAAITGNSALNIGASNTLTVTAGINYYTNDSVDFANTATISGGTLVIDSGGASTDFAIENNTEISGAELTISSQISSAGANDDFKKSGTGTLRVNGTTHDYQGRLVLSGGTLQIEDASALGTKNMFTGDGDSDVTIEFVGHSDIIVGEDYRVGDGSSGGAAETGGLVFKNSGSAKMEVSGGVSSTANATADRTLTFSGGNQMDNVVSGVIADHSSNAAAPKLNVVKDGTGTWTLAGANTYTGTTTVQAGNLVLEDTSSLYGGILADYTNDQITVASGATLTLDFDNDWNPFNGGSNTRSFDLLTELSGEAGKGLLDGSNVGIHSSVNEKLYNQILSDSADGAIGFVKTGGEGLRFNKTHTYTGGTRIEEGYIKLEGGATGGDLTGAVAISDGASLVYAKTVTGGTTSANDISGGGSVLFNAANTGKVILTGTNTYTGGTTINQGTVLFNGDSSGATGAVSVTAATGTATLGGTGSIGGAVTVGANGILAPGASIETFEVGALSFVDGSAFNVEIDSGVATSAGADLTIVNGDLSLAGVVTLNLSDLGVGVILEGTVFSVVTYSGVWNDGLFTVGGSLIADGETFVAAGQEWMLDYAASTGGENFTGEYLGGGSFVNLTAVPEPSSYALIAGMLGLVSVMVRRRI